MKDDPYISVVIPVYNKKNHIERAIISVVNQTMSNWELIVVNDGSTDGSEQVLKEIKNSKIRIVNQKNKGVSVARNNGIGIAKYQYIAFLDGDDAWEKDFLSTISELIKLFPQSGAFATSYFFINKGTTRQVKIFKSLSNNFNGILSDVFNVVIRDGSPLTASSVCINKKVFDSAGAFPIGVSRGEDLDMWYRIYLNYTIAFANEPKVNIYRNAENRSIDLAGPPKGEIFVVEQLQAILNSNLEIEKAKKIDKLIANGLLKASSRCLHFNDYKGAYCYLFDRRTNALPAKKLKLVLKFLFKKLTNV